MTATIPGARAPGRAAPTAARLRAADLARLAVVGLRTRKLRAALSALGIAIGVAAIVAVLGLSASSAAGLNAEIAALGTNLLTVQPGQSLTGGNRRAAGRRTRDDRPAARRLPGAVHRGDERERLPLAADPGGEHQRADRRRRHPRACPPPPAPAWRKGSSSTPPPPANRSACSAPPPPSCWASTRCSPASGSGSPAPAPTATAACGCMWPASCTPTCCPPTSTPRCWSGSRSPSSYLSFDGHPTTIYVKATDSQVNAVYNLLGDQANPEEPQRACEVSQPSDALVAQADAKAAFSTLFLGLGAVALLVGAIGVANIMVIAVLERRSEIGLRRALGATRGQIRTQFLAEAIALSLVGGVAGIIAGAAATAIYAHGKGWATVIPADAWAGGLAAAILIGALAGLLPAIKAARLSPTQALWSL